MIQKKKWENVITPESSYFFVQLKSLWEYRDLLRMFVKRDFVALYKQTILGPLWFFIQPFITSVAFYFVFNRVAGIGTSGIPPILFYLSGIALWNFFAECFTKVSTTFKDNQNIFGKVYFPRLIVPLSILISGLLKFLVQFFLFAAFYFYFLLDPDYTVQPTPQILMFPVFLMLTAGLALGFGLIFTSLTIKYRDLVFVLTYGVQLLMFATPVVYPLESVGEERWILLINPLTSVVEGFRYAFLGQGEFSLFYLGISTVVTIFIIFAGVIVFNKSEKTFMDVI